MYELVSFSLVTFSAIFFVVDPIAAIPLFVTMTRAETLEQKKRTALRAAIVATFTLLVFAAAGGLIFKLFGITIGAFKIAGGILLFQMALDMMRAQKSRTRTSPEEESEGIEKEDVAVIPIGIPMLAGPGAIATVTVLMSQAWPDVMHIGVVVGAILLTGALTYVMLRGATMLERSLKRTGLNILNRLMGLILAAVAVQIIVGGVTDVLPLVMKKP
ncbi:MAG: MarC family protein [Planctomycetota bacterium]